MTQRLILRPMAEEDVAGAFRWYESQREGLGAEFLSAVEATLAVIEREPLLHPGHHRHARRALLQRFPYAIFYVAGSELVEVIACMHVRRHPRTWQSRL